MGSYYKVAFHETRSVIDPSEVDINPKRAGLPVWAGLIAYGAMAGWGVPVLLNDEADGARGWDAARGYADRTREAAAGAAEVGLYVADGGGRP